MGKETNKDSEKVPVVYTPSDEPYLGRELLFHFDRVIQVVMEENVDTARKTYDGDLTDHQKMACQVIAQATSIALSIRELIRQGYLFGAHVLLRPLVERTAILLYLNLCPEEIEVWKRGWNQKDAPGLARMFDVIQAKQGSEERYCGRDITASMNSLLHAKPDSAPWNLIMVDEKRFGHAVSKILNRPDLCDDICANAIPWIAVIAAMISAYFPDEAESD